MPRPITEADIYKEIKSLLNYPFPQICRHSVVCNLLHMLEVHGYEINDDFVRAVVGCHDLEALALLPTFEEEGGAAGEAP